MANVGFQRSEKGFMCQKCWAQDNGMACAGCGEMIVPDMGKPVQFMTINGKEYHKECVKCSECGTAFSDDTPGPYLVNGVVLCKEHASARKQSRRAPGAGTAVTEDTDEGKKLNAIFKAARSGWK